MTRRETPAGPCQRTILIPYRQKTCPILAHDFNPIPESDNLGVSLVPLQTRANGCGVRAVQSRVYIILRFYVYIFVDLEKGCVLTIVGDIPCYRNDRYSYYHQQCSSSSSSGRRRRSNNSSSIRIPFCWYNRSRYSAISNDYFSIPLTFVGKLNESLLETHS